MPANPKVRVEISAIDRATATIKGVSNQISGISSSLMKLGAAYATVRVGFAAFEQLTTKVAAYSEEILIASQITGMTTEQVSALRFAAGQDRIEFEALTKSLGIFARNLVNVGGKGNDVRRVLEGMGLSSRDASGKILPMHDLLLSVADRFSKMRDGAQKAAIAQALFGRSGAALIPLLNQGAAGIEELEKKAAALGITLDEKSARAADAFGDQMQILGEAVHGVTLQIASAMMPTMLRWTVDLENIVYKMTACYRMAKALGYAWVALTAAELLQIGTAKTYWQKATEEYNSALDAEGAYEKGVAESTLELERRMRIVKALGEIDEFGGPEKEKKAKSRKSDLEEYIRLLRELRPEASAWVQAQRDYLEIMQRIAQLEAGEDTALLIRLADQKRLTAETAAMLEEQKKFQAALKVPPGVPGVLQEALDMTKATIPAFNAAAFAGRKFGAEIGDAFAQMIVYGRGGIQMLQSLLEMIVAAILKAYVFKAIWKSFGGAAGEAQGGWTGFLAGLFGGLAGIGGRQFGGSVFSGMPYLVGERGPELFVPQVAGSIVSNRNIAGNTTYYTIDARGADISVERRLLRALQIVEQRAVGRSVALMRETELRTA